MGRSRCLRGTSGVEVNSAEGRTSNFKSVWFLPNAGKKNSCTSQGCQLTPVLEDSAVRENAAGKAGASSELFMGQVDWRADRHRGRGIHDPQPPARLKARGKLM